MTATTAIALSVIQTGTKMKISNQVENILSVSKKARNSDKELLIIYMQKFGLDLSPQQIELFKKMPSAETITRCRRLLQEEGKYLPTKEVDQARFEKYQEFKEYPKAISWMSEEI